MQRVLHDLVKICKIRHRNENEYAKDIQGKTKQYYCSNRENTKSKSILKATKAKKIKQCTSDSPLILTI